MHKKGTKGTKVTAEEKVKRGIGNILEIALDLIIIVIKMWPPVNRCIDHGVEQGATRLLFPGAYFSPTTS